MNYPIEKLSFTNLLQEYYDRTHKIERNVVDNVLNSLSMLSLAIIIFLSFITWIWANYVLIKYWKVLPKWAKVLGILGLIPVVPLGPIITLICVYTGKQQ